MANVTVSWACDSCGHSGSFETSEENLKEYWAYYAVLKAAHYEKTVGSCGFIPDRIHVTSVKRDGVEIQNAV